MYLLKEFFQNFEIFENLIFAPYGATIWINFVFKAARRRRTAFKKNSNFSNMEKNYFLLKIIFSLIVIALKVLRM